MPAKIALSLLLAVTFTVLPVAPAVAGEGTWSPVGPTGGFTRSSPLFTHPAAPGALWVGLYKSVDRGTTWSFASAPLPADAQYFSPLAADPSAPGAMWVATKARLLHTRGNGARWRTVSSPTYSAVLGAEDPGQLTVPGDTPATLYLTTYRRLLASLDSGVTWQTLYDGDGTQRVLDVVPASPAVLYLHTVDLASDFVSEHLRKSEDGGHTWTLLPCPVNPGGGCNLRSLVASQGALFVTPGVGEPGLLRSADGGSTWTKVLGSRPGEPVSDISLLADPQVPGKLWALGESPRSLWFSLDNGDRWTRRSAPPIRRLAALGPEPGTLYAFSDLGIARSVNGGRTWNDVFPILGDPDRPPARISFQPGNPARAAFVYGHRLFRSNDGGATWWWVTAAPGGVNDVVFDPADPDKMVAVSSVSAAITTNDGRTWSPAGSLGYAETLVRATGKTLYAGGCGVSRSRDNGRTWALVLPCSSPRDRRAGQYVQKLLVDPAHPDVVYALTFLDKDFYPNHGPMNGLPSNLWQSRDGGKTWKSLATDMDAFALDAASARLWIARGDAVSASDDSGVRWRVMSRAPLDQNSQITDLVVPPGLAGTLYLAETTSLLRTRDDGRTWESLGPRGTSLLTLSPADPRRVFDTSHEGIFQLRLPE